MFKQVKEDKCPVVLQVSNQLIVGIDNIDDVQARAVARGAKVEEESIICGSVLHVIRCPHPMSKTTLIVVDNNHESSRKSDLEMNSCSFVNTLRMWCLRALDAHDTAGRESNNNVKDSQSRDGNNAKLSSPNSRAWNPPPGPAIPTLFPSVLHEGVFREFAPNSSLPVPFKTDFFEGEVLLMVRTTPLEPRYKHIFQRISDITPSTTKATFEVHCQGKFTAIPNGKLFIGAEITKKMNLGLFTRGLCRTVLQFVNSINPFIHSSFGDDSNSELPHIVGPLWSLADKVVVTSPSETPPKLGHVLQEDNDSRARRRSHKLLEEEIDLQSTYSFSVNTNNIELCDWNMVNIPLMKAMDLHTFWDDADLRLCCYCVPCARQNSAKNEKDVVKSLPKHHYQSSIQYLMCVQLEHLTNHPGRAPNSNSYGNVNDDLGRDLLSTSGLYFSHDISEEICDSSDSDDLFFDAIDNEDYFVQNRITSIGRQRSSIRSVPRSVHSEQPETSSFNFVPAALLISDIVRRRSVLGVGTGRRELYLFCAPEALFHDPSSFSTLNSNTMGSVRTTLSSYKEFEKKFQVEGCFNSHAYSRMSRTEQRRLDLQHSMSRLFSSAISNITCRNLLIDFFKADNHTEYFLLANKISTRNVKNGVGNPRLRADMESALIMEGYVCTRVGQSHWSEEYLCASERELVFIQHSPRLTEKKRRIIPWTDILSIKVVDSKISSFPMGSCYCIVIATFAKEISIIVRGESMLDRWLEVLLGLHESSSESVLRLANSFKHSELFSNSADWSLGSRVLLNVRKFIGKYLNEEKKQDIIGAVLSSSQLLSGNPIPKAEKDHGIGTMHDDNPMKKTLAEGDGEKYFNNSLATKGVDVMSHAFPLLLVDNALRLIYKISTLSNSESSMGCDGILEANWMSFLDLVSVLPCINLEKYNLSHEELLCIYLNLYHTMLLHAVLVAGVPSSSLKWPSFFNTLSYEAFGDVFSLAELEHSIIKHGKSFSVPNIVITEIYRHVEFKTNGIISHLLIRQSKFDFPSPKKDFRLLFSLNCGSLSLPKFTPIFSPSTVEQQLDDCVRYFVRFDSIAHVAFTL